MAAPAVGVAQTILNTLEGPQQARLDQFLRRAASDTWAHQTINEMDHEVLDRVVHQTRSLQRLEAEELTELVVDISNVYWSDAMRVASLPRALARQQRAGRA